MVATGTRQKSLHSSEERFKPWVVLVMGVNGIRKTTSTYQNWFSAAVKTALATMILMSISSMWLKQFFPPARLYDRYVSK